MKPQCRILLVDDHKLLMEGVRSLISTRKDMTVVGMATSGEEGLRMAARTAPHIVIMDISMPGMNGVECTRALRGVCPDARVIIYTMHADQRFLLELFQAGIAGHVLKEDAPSVLLEAIHEVSEGRNFFSHSDTCAPMLALLEQRPATGQDEGVGKLSRREKEIFIMLADGQSLRMIAEKLHISLKTVEAHKYNICNKLQTSSLSELTKIALRGGLITI